MSYERELSIQKLETLFDMTSHKGWHGLQDDLKEKVEFIKDQLSISEMSAYEQGKAHGYLQLSRELLNLRSFSEAMIKQARESDEQIDNV